MKPKIYRIILLIYIVIPLFSILIIIKPNASIFYYKDSVKNELIETDKGFAYRYLLNSNFLAASYDLSLLYENDLLLTRSDFVKNVRDVQGRFVFSETDDGNSILYFSPTDGSKPKTNQKNYVIYHHIAFFSRPLGFFYLIIWALGSFWFGTIKFKSSKKHQITKLISIQRIKFTSFNSNHWKYIFLITVIAVDTLVFMEWLFFATKPSFMDVLNWWEKFEIFLLTSSLLSFIGIVILLILTGIDYFLFIRKTPSLLRFLGLIVPTFIFSLLALMMVDNFTYTVFKFGVVTTGGIWRGIYAFILIVVFIEIFIKLYEIFDFRENVKVRQNFKLLSLIVISVFVFSIIVALSPPRFIGVNSWAEEDNNLQNVAKYPNIILLGSDGLNAKNMSVYGYERETTPRIKELARSSIIAENAFPNAGNSAGSVISILTSKLPTQTRLSYPPDILKGSDAYQHLPGILKREGYKNFEIAVPHYVDSFTLNMQNGFDIVNGRSDAKDNPFHFLNKLGYYDVSYFISTLFGRIEERLLHIFYLEKMANPYKTVTQPSENQVFEDREKIDQLLDIVIYSDNPVFVHVHLMGTHGPKFFPNQQVYSKGKEQNEPWMTDFYDDAILDFDTYVGKVIDELMNTGEIDNTILIIYTDHAQKYNVNIRVPLLIHFPRDEHTGSIRTNVQNLDISPTILDYLGLPQPDWMGGDSLLKTDDQDQRLIFSTKITEKVTESNGYWNLDVDRLSPPFYQFGYVYIIDCQKWHMIDLELMQWDSGEIAGQTSPCKINKLFSLNQIKNAVIEHLADEGFDISSFP